MDATRIEMDQTRIQPGQKWNEKYGLKLVTVFDYDSRREEVFILDTRKPECESWLPEEEFRRDYEFLPDEDDAKPKQWICECAGTMGDYGYQCMFCGGSCNREWGK